MSKITKMEQGYVDYEWGVRLLLAREDEITLARFLLFAPEVDFCTLYENFDISYIPTLDKVFRLIEGYLLKTLDGFKPDLNPLIKVISNISLQFNPLDLGKPKLKYKNNYTVTGNEYISYKCYSLISNLLSTLYKSRNPAYRDALACLRSSTNIDPNIFIVLLIDNKIHMNHEFLMNIFDYSGTSVEYLLTLMKFIFKRNLHKVFDFTPYIEKYISLKSTFLHDLISVATSISTPTTFKFRSIFGKDVERLVKQMLTIYLEGAAFTKCDKFLEDLYNRYSDENRDIEEIRAIETYRKGLLDLMENGYLNNIARYGVADNSTMVQLGTSTLYRNYDVFRYTERLLATNIDDMIVGIYMTSLFSLFSSDPNIRAEVESGIALVANGLFDFNPKILIGDTLKYYINSK